MDGYLASWGLRLVKRGSHVVLPLMAQGCPQRYGFAPRSLATDRNMSRGTHTLRSDVRCQRIKTAVMQDPRVLLPLRLGCQPFPMT